MAEIPLNRQPKDESFLLETCVFPQLPDLYESDENVWTANCPCHNDKNRNLTITNSPLMFKCRSGCSLYAICERLGVAQSETLFPGFFGIFIEQKTEYLERNAIARKEYYQEWLLAGLGQYLPAEDKQDYKALSLASAVREK